MSPAAVIAALTLTACAASTRPMPVGPDPSGADVEVVVLGTAQDGGLPHVGCHAEPCERARRDRSLRRPVVSIGIIDRRAQKRFLVEATPDLPAQIDALDAVAGGPRLRGVNPVDGVVLTHGHIGHYTGLVHFGKEVASTRQLPIFGTERMLAFLRGSGPWSLLFDLGQVEGHVLEPDDPAGLTGNVRLVPILVPHRDELTDTLGIRIEGPTRKLLFIPDIDRWESWDRRIEDEVRAVDVALLDATFYSAAELPGRSLADIPHPLVTETVARLRALARSRRVILIHMNHSNPICDPASPESRAVREAGLEIAREGLRIPL